ncbi:InlB B-repeat-containing protein [Paenibacillus sp. PAMC21692]|uniref:InlB B-repeat-containing protein n=1 Tax=Paenibacillus sp. PAMC21692 TaxID=2762320 RepID=UPI00164DE813|nr:InlB B-repeat-containing protein [Paenibacillus sp. PAMC21692]QNK57458.1 InlB B-repeat-containing protein [Paenibacillus sp. PAMC21692]
MLATNKKKIFLLMLMCCLLLSGCITNSTSVTFNLDADLSNSYQIYLRYSDGTTATTTSGQQGSSGVTIPNPTGKTIVGAFVTDHRVSWVPTYSYPFSPNQVNVENVNESKPDKPAAFAVLQTSSTVSGNVDVVFEIYDADHNPVHDRTEVFAQASGALFYNNDPKDGRTDQDPVSGYSSFTNAGLVTFKVNTGGKQLSDFSWRLFSGPSLIHSDDDTDLIGLQLSQGELRPSSFMPGKTDYRAVVPDGTTSLTVTAAPYNPAAEITVNGQPVLSGEASGAIDLSASGNRIAIRVTAPDQSVKTYNVHVAGNLLSMEGSGTASDPYLIANADLLDQVRYYNTGAGIHFKQTAHIDLAHFANDDGSKGWVPIGNSFAPFLGQYDGNGFSIANLTLYRQDENDAGLFGYTGLSGTVSNVLLQNVSIQAGSRTGGLIGYNNGTAINNFVTGSVTSKTTHVGGLVGQNNGTIRTSHANAIVTGVNMVGGLVGYNSFDINQNNVYGLIEDSYAIGQINLVDVNSTGATGAGGLVGINHNGTITQSFYNSELLTPPASHSLLGTAKTTAEMKNQETFDSAGWDFDQVWAMDPENNSGYPYLQNMSPPNTYVVAYDSNGSTGGEVPVDSGTYETGSTVTILGNTGNLVRAGYTFTGWNTAADGSGTDYAAGATFPMAAADVTLYAQWTANPTYTVTYNGNGSTGGALPVDSGAYETGSTVTVLGNTGNLVRAGHTFTGWNTAADGSGTNYVAGATFPMATADVTLYAQWTANPTYTVTYNGNGSTGGAVPVDSGAYETGSTVTVLGNSGNLVRAGHTFTGWNTAADGSGTNYVAGATFPMATADVTLYAQWTANPTYTVTYDGNGSTDGTVPVDNGAYENGSTITVLGNTGNLVRAGHTFTGWNTAADGSGTNYVAGATFPMATADVTLYAQWTANPTYTVTYDGNGSTDGTVPVDNGAYENGSTITVLGNTGNLVRAGHTFTGWNTAEDGSGTNYTDGATFPMAAADITLYAKWQIISSDPQAPIVPVGPILPTNGVDVLINGQAVSAGIATTKIVNGRSVTTVELSADKLSRLLLGTEAGSVLTIPIKGESHSSIGALNGKLFESLTQQQAVLSLQSGKAIYSIHTSLIDLQALIKHFGTSVVPKDITIQLEISEPETGAQAALENAAKENKFSLAGPPVSFEVKVVHGDKSILVSSFDSYVERLIPLPDGFNPALATTGVVLEANGTVRHVPTMIVTIDGKNYARIMSMTNSTYAVIRKNVVYSDVESHWSKDAVNDMGSRMIIKGIGGGLFQPDRDMTRAEFAAIIVRALGLSPEGGETSFADVAATNWYYGTVSTAHAYNLITGYEDGSFRPSERVTREQAMTSIARAMKLAGPIAEPASLERLQSFADANAVSAWAISGIADSLQAGIVTGRSTNVLAPIDYVTRAEVAVMVRKLLVHAELIS